MRVFVTSIVALVVIAVLGLYVLDLLQQIIQLDDICALPSRGGWP